MRKRIVTLGVIASLVASMFTGCGDSKSGDIADGGQTSAPTETASLGDFWADYEVDTTNNLSNPNATEKTCAVYNWLCSIQGKYCITGLQEAGSDMEEFKYIKDLSGELPGLRGLDFINGDYEGVVRRSKTWAKQNSIITICWHMGIPGNIDGGYNSSKDDSYKGRLAAALNDPDSDDYKQFVEDIDKAVPYLQELQEANIVVLWRPFHEFDGKWFWWGMDGGEAFKKAWQLMYDRYTNVYGLNNLIWVLGYSGNGSCGSDDWYPGDEYCDIIGADSYSNNAADAGYAGMYDTLAERRGTAKPFTLHECGRMPNLNCLKNGDANWLYFMVWARDYIDVEDQNKSVFVMSYFQDDYFLTLSEMPDFNAVFDK